MAVTLNEWGQPVGEVVADWQARPRPTRFPMIGRFCQLEPIDPDRHGASLHAANAAAPDARSWTYLAYGPFKDLAAYTAWVRQAAASEDPLFHAIILGEIAVGVASYLRIDPPNGVIEVGHIHLTAALQRRPAATEAMYLMMRRAFDELGYRRYEWKCDALNAPSRAAAERLGFTFEGIFRQAVVTKGRNRDTAWYAIVDRDWPAIRAALEAWLDPGNFDADGRQRRSLRSFSAAPISP